ncbi:MAG: hypothetical protein K8I03_05745, partial [Ignavibacteria bacterium]|nr:hypothetical protein [Ignavibacteria bacterium]
SFNSVVIVNKHGFTDAESQKIKKYIDDGGGVIIYPGSSVNIDSYNSNLFKVLDIPFIVGRFTSGNGNNSLTFDKVDMEHPVFEGIFKKGTGDKKFSLESPGIRSGINLSTGENSIAPVKLNNEKNFMVEYSKGKGKLIVFAISPDMSESDYPVKNLFSPVTVRSILYLANINNISPAVTGKDYFFDPSRFGNISDTLKLTGYHGSAKEENNFPLTDRAALIDLKNYNSSSGNYSISSGGKDIFKYACIYDNRESNTGRYNSVELQKYTSDSYGISVNIIEPAETISADIVELRTGREMWQYFLILGLIFLCIEFFLARSVKKKVT